MYGSSGNREPFDREPRTRGYRVECMCADRTHCISIDAPHDKFLRRIRAAEPWRLAGVTSDPEFQGAGAGQEASPQFLGCISAEPGTL
jgi:hypothetical protein